MPVRGEHEEAPRTYDGRNPWLSPSARPPSQLGCAKRVHFIHVNFPMNKSYQEFSDSIDIKRITRTVEKFRHRMAISDYAMRDIADSTHFHGLKWETYHDEIGRRMILELQAKIASKKFDVKTVRFPDGAWQACKHALSQSGPTADRCRAIQENPQGQLAWEKR